MSDNSEDKNQLQTIVFQPNFDNMSEKQKHFWHLCQEYEDYCSNCLSSQPDSHQLAELNRKHVQTFETTDEFKFYPIENPDQYWTVRLIQKNFFNNQSLESVDSVTADQSALIKNKQISIKVPNSEDVNQIKKIDFQPNFYCKDNEYSQPYFHSTVEFIGPSVQIFKTNEKYLFYSSENTEPLRDVRCMSLIGSTISVEPLKSIDHYCQKLECLFLNINEFDGNSFQYFVSNICPKLKYLSLDNPIHIRNQKGSINFDSLIKMCSKLADFKLILCPPNTVYAFNYTCITSLCENLALISNEYQVHNKRTIICQLNEFYENSVPGLLLEQIQNNLIDSDPELDDDYNSNDDNKIKTIEFQINSENMSERQKFFLQLCEESKENWRDGVCSDPENHPSKEINRNNVQIFEKIEDFLTTENTEQLMDVRSISLIGSAISLRLLEFIDMFCPKLECLFMNLTEFNDNSFEYFVGNICPKLLHLSLDNSIYVRNRDLSINFKKMVKMFTKLEELKLILFPFNMFNMGYAFNFNCLRYLGRDFVQIFVKFYDHKKRKRFCRLRQNNLSYQSIMSSNNRQSNNNILDHNDWQGDNYNSDEEFVEDQNKIYYREDFFEKNELDELLDNIGQSEARPEYMRIESHEPLTRPISALERLSKFVFLRALNISIKNSVIFWRYPGVNYLDGEYQSTEDMYKNIAKNLSAIEALSLSFHEYEPYYNYYPTDEYQVHVLDLFFEAAFRSTLKKLKVKNAVLNRKLMKKIQQNFFNLQCLQLFDCIFEEQSDLTESEEISDTVPIIIPLMNNLNELIVDYSESDLNSDEIFFKFEHLLKIVKSCANKLKYVQLTNVGFTLDQEHQMTSFLNYHKIKFIYE